jgi:pimeloyl-ACP methyl ester carboxylesterase
MILKSKFENSPYRMIPHLLHIEGRRMRYAVTLDSPVGNAIEAELTRAKAEHRYVSPVSPKLIKEFIPRRQKTWLINIHGFFAGGGMYWRESSYVSQENGFWVFNPSLPGFGGSDSLLWEELSMKGMARRIVAMMDVFGIENAIIMGHSMGGAIALEMAVDYPDRVLGVIYRDGAGTPSWKDRKSPFTMALAPIVPDAAAILDLFLAAAMDIPDLALGKFGSTLKSILPDFRKNIRSLGRTLPAAAMLFGSDLTDFAIKLGQEKTIPFLVEWGATDQITPPKTAYEFQDVIGEEVIWLWGGHSWMLARPSTQSWILKYHDQGRKFLNKVKQRQLLLKKTGAEKLAKVTSIKVR